VTPRLLVNLLVDGRGEASRPLQARELLHDLLDDAFVDEVGLPAHVVLGTFGSVWSTPFSVAVAGQLTELGGDLY